MWLVALMTPRSQDGEERQGDDDGWTSDKFNMRKEGDGSWRVVTDLMALGIAPTKPSHFRIAC